MRHNLVAEALGKELAERRQGARCRNHLAPPASEIDKVPRDLGALGTCTVPQLGAVVCKCCGQDQFQVACAVLTVERAADKVKQALQRRCAHARQLALGGGGVRDVLEARLQDFRGSCRARRCFPAASSRRPAGAGLVRETLREAGAQRQGALLLDEGDIGDVGPRRVLRSSCMGARRVLRNEAELVKDVEAVAGDD